MSRADSTIEVRSNGHTLSVPIVAFQGSASTLCKGCGHNSITSRLIDAAKTVGLNPYTTIKMSGIGCSSKTPAYFLNYSHGFNTLHGRMPSVTTGALLANHRLKAIGISGDGDTANIGLGQFKHACRRNLSFLYIIENNGCYGLTKGQFSATADLHARLRRPTGEENPVVPFDLCLEAIIGGATFVARSFAGDKKQLDPLLQAALAHNGLAVLDIISPCVTFNDFAESTKSWEWGRVNELPIHELGFVPHLLEIEVEQQAGEATSVRLHDGSQITLRSLRDEEHDVTSRGSAIDLILDSQERAEFITGLLYVDPKRPGFSDTLDLSDTPLAHLPDEALRPGPEALAEAMREF